MEKDETSQARQLNLYSPLRYNLTISHAKRFVWYRVAKVGTRSIFKHFQRHEVPLNIKEAMWIHYPTRKYEEYYRFAFFRDPWDRLVSCWRNKVCQGNYFKFDANARERMQQFGVFLDWLETQDLRRCDHHICPQSRLIDLNQVDFLGRFENFQDDFTIVCRKLAIPADEIPQINRSARSEGKDAILRLYHLDRVRKIYEKDYRIFGAMQC